MLYPYNLFYFEGSDNLNLRYEGRYESSLSNWWSRPIKRKYLTLNVPGFPHSDSIRLYYHYDPDSEWPYRSIIELQVSGGSFANRELVENYLLPGTKDSIASGELLWLEDKGCPYSICRYNIETISSKEMLCRTLDRMMEIFDPIFSRFNEDKKKEERHLRYGKGILFNKDLATQKKDLEYDIVKVRDLDFSSFKIPDYQRTYKWSGKNVNQLINDIISFKDNSSYRLGTLVLNNGDIVDGQQRIVTIALLFSQLIKIKENKDEADAQYKHLEDTITGFWKGTAYKSAIAIRNINANLETIKRRESELNLEFFHTLLDKCEFVVIKLKSTSEAFQFFDSQNSRGKDLSPHDLLKAFHLREIPLFLDHDKENITSWQKIQTEDLEKLFLTMFRIKRWSKGLTAREFHKDNVSEFKGLSLKVDSRGKPNYPFYGPAFYLYHMFCGQDLHNYPFQLDGEITNGSLFFDMVLHYNDVKNSIYKPELLKKNPETQKILRILDSYDKRNRIGDTYVRDLFDALMVYYVDKFGHSHLDKAAEQFFLYAYRIRLEYQKVSIATIDREVLDGVMFQAIRDASSPLDLMDVNIPNVVPEKNCSIRLKEEFKIRKKIIEE